jgi:hypothetical protein
MNIFKTGTNAPWIGTTSNPIITEKKNSRPLKVRNVNPKAAYAANRRGKIVAGIVTANEEIKLAPNLFSVKTVEYELISQFCENGLSSTSHQPLFCASSLDRREVINNPTVGINQSAASRTKTKNDP